MRIPRVASGTGRMSNQASGLQERARLSKEIATTRSTIQFPWWKTGYIYDKPAAEIPIPFQAINQLLGDRQPAFKNDTDRRVLVDRLVFNVLAVSAAASSPGMENFTVTVKTAQKDLIYNWLPITTLHTNSMFLLGGGINQGLFVLPAPYYLKAQSNMTGIVIGPFTATYQATTLNIALHGYNPVDFDPVVAATTVTLPNGGVPGTTAEAPFSFRENRDGLLRDMIVEKIVVSASDTYDGVSNPGTWLQNVMLRFEPPEGPKWSDDFATQFISLAEQANTGVYFDFARPVILEPGQSIDVTMKSLVDYSRSQTFKWIACTAIGTQEGVR